MLPACLPESHPLFVCSALKNESEFRWFVIEVQPLHVAAVTFEAKNHSMKIFLTISSVPGTVLGAVDTAVNRSTLMKLPASWNFHFKGGDRLK